MATFDFSHVGSSTKRCEVCGKSFTAARSYYRKCSACYRKEKDNETWEEGYRAGFFAGRAASNSDRVAQLDDATIKALITFVHPDRNPGRSEEATQLTAILNQLRGKR